MLPRRPSLENRYKEWALPYREIYGKKPITLYLPASTFASFGAYSRFLGEKYFSSPSNRGIWEIFYRRSHSHPRNMVNQVIVGSCIMTATLSDGMVGKRPALISIALKLICGIFFPLHFPGYTLRRYARRWCASALEDASNLVSQPEQSFARRSHHPSWWL